MVMGREPSGRLNALHREIAMTVNEANTEHHADDVVRHSRVQRFMTSGL